MKSASFSETDFSDLVLYVKSKYFQTFNPLEHFLYTLLALVFIMQRKPFLLTR